MPAKIVKLTPEKPAPEKKSHGMGITIFSAVVLVVIVVTFIGAPVVSKVSEQPSYVFGSYDGVPIEYQQGNTFAQQVESLTRFYEQFNRGSQNLDLQRQMIWRQAFEQTATEIALKREAERAGIVITDKQLDEELVNNPAYQRDGKFSDEAYRNVTSAERFRIRQDTRTKLMIQQYVQDHTDAILQSSASNDFMLAMAYPQRKFSYISFTDVDFPEAQVRDYAVKNTALFRSIDLSRITISTSEADANRIREEAVKGEKAFADLAKTYSKDTAADTGGALYSRTYSDLKSEIPTATDLDKLFTLPKNAISPLMKSEKSWVFYKINTPATNLDLTKPESLATVRTYLIQNERGLVEDYLESLAKTFQSQAVKNWDSAVRGSGKTSQTTDWIALNFGNHELFPQLSKAAKDSTIQGLAANEDFFKKAFHQPQGGITAPVLANGSALVFRVDAIKAAPEATDTPVTAQAVASQLRSDRTQILQQSILQSPLFKDQFNEVFTKLFKTTPE